MNTLQINEEMKNFSCYKGTFSKNLLPQKIINERPIAFIINTDNNDKPGEHWVSIFISRSNTCQYFDSFGRYPLQEIINFLKINNIKYLTYNTKILQSFYSNTCGAFCILFVKLRCSNFSFKNFINLFTNNNISNDELAVKIL